MASGLVSVIIPAYNRAHYLPQTIKSALEQDYTPVEVLVIDDGSTDDTGQVVADLQKVYGKERIRYHYKANGGCASAQNAGLALARGDYIGILGSDDLYLPGNISTLVEAIRESGRDFAFGGWIVEVNGERSGLTRPVGASNPDQMVIEHFSSNPNFSLCAALFRRECALAVGGFDEALLLNEDSDFVQRLLAAGFKGMYVDQPMCVWRVHPGGKSRNRVGIRMAQIQSAEKAIAEYPQLRSQLGERYQATMADLWWLLGEAHADKGNWSAAILVWEKSASFLRPTPFRRMRLWLVSRVGFDPAPVARPFRRILLALSNVTARSSVKPD